MRRHGSDPRDLVGADRHPESRAADQKRSVGFARLDQFRGVDGCVRVGSFVRCLVYADVDDFGDAWVGFQVGFDLVLVVASGVVGAHGDAEASWSGVF